MGRRFTVAVACWGMLLAGAGAAAQEACEGCYALLIWPDTQHATERANQPAGGESLRAVTRYACDQRASWVEPGTGKTMPIQMVVHLGDLVQAGWAGPGRPDGVAERQWRQIDRAFDTLDTCGMPYLVVLGNHDGDQQRSKFATHAQLTDGFNHWFAAPCMEDDGLACADDAPRARSVWQAGRCLAPPDCELPRQWYLGNGPDIAPLSRKVGPGNPGPARPQAGRHRAGLVGTPDGGQMLILGLDYGLDWGLPAPSVDDLAWVEALLGKYPDTPTILVHHTFGNDGRGGLGALVSSRAGNAAANAWARLVAPNPQIAMTLTGHWIGTRAHNATQATGNPTRAVHRLFRNFQSNNTFGWVAMLVFDPRAGELRVRSVQIVNEGDGAPKIGAMDIQCMKKDPRGPHCPTTLSWPPRLP